MKKRARRGGAAIEGIAINRETMLGSMDTNLMGAAGHWFGLNQGELLLNTSHLKAGFGSLSTWRRWTTYIFFSSAHNTGFRRERIGRRLSVGQQQIFFLNRARSELFCQRSVRFPCFSKNHYTACFLI